MERSGKCSPFQFNKLLKTMIHITWSRKQLLFNFLPFNRRRSLFKKKKLSDPVKILAILPTEFFVLNSFILIGTHFFVQGNRINMNIKPLFLKKKITTFKSLFAYVYYANENLQIPFFLLQLHNKIINKSLMAILYTNEYDICKKHVHIHKPL